MMKHNSLYTLTLALLVSFTTQLNAQNCIDLTTELGQQNRIQCYNYDFNVQEEIDYNTYITYYTMGWIPSLCPAGNNHPRQVLISTNQPDDLCPYISTLPPNGTHSIRLSNDGYRGYGEFAKGEGIGIKFQVTEDNYIFTLHYAAILELSNHTNLIGLVDPVTGFNYGEYAEPWINIYLADENKNIITESYTQHAVSDPNTTQGWMTDGVVAYQDWTSITYNFGSDLFMGKTIYLMIDVYDCALQDAGYDSQGPFLNTCDDYHQARVYCSFDCGKIEEEQHCENGTTTLTIPEGFEHYIWTNKYGQQISTSNVVTLPLPQYPNTETYHCQLSNPTYNELVFDMDITLSDDCQGEISNVKVPQVVCADANSLDFYVQTTKNASLNFDIVFDDAALRNGFQNIYDGMIARDGSFSVDMPFRENAGIYVQPNNYDATLTIHYGFGNDTIVPFTFSVLYPSWIVRQQWNDVLAVLNKDYNGGYDFTNVRWFKGEGEELTGKGTHNGYLYVGPDAELDFGVQYWAELTRTSDGRAICSCPLIPIHNNAAPKKVVETEKVRLAPLFPNNTHNVKISSEISGDYIVYTISGMQIATGKFGPAYGKESIILTMPGTYIIEFIGNEGTVETRKWLVE